MDMKKKVQDALSRAKNAPLTPSLPATKPKGPPKQKVVLKHACGHEKPVKELENTACSTCLKQNRMKAIARKREKREAQQTALPDKNIQANRLPHGAVFNVVYDAQSQTWTGDLTIGEAVFQGTENGVFFLLQRLDRDYRASLVK